MIARYRKPARGDLEVPLDPFLCRRNLRTLTRRGRRTAMATSVTLAEEIEALHEAVIRRVNHKVP